MTVRRATRDDLDDVARLVTALGNQHVGFDPRRFQFPEPPLPAHAAFFREQIACEEARVLLACVDDVTVGYAFVRREPASLIDARGESVWLHDLYVTPSHRATGLGRALMVAAWDAAAELGASRLYIVVASANAAALRLFARYGFTTTMLEMAADRPDDGGPGTGGLVDPGVGDLRHSAAVRVRRPASS